MGLIRILGWLLILAALLVVANEAYGWLDQGSYRVTAAGQLWYSLSPGSLNLLQAGVQRHLTPVLWDDLIRPLLLLPAWLVLGLPGLLLLLLVRRRPRRRRHPSSFG